MKGIVHYTALLHAAWGGGLIAGLDIQHITPLHSTVDAFGIWAGFALLGASILASVWEEGKSFGWIIPQQFLVAVGAVGALGAAIRGSYADGVIHPHLFILMDQLPVIMLAVIHTIIAFTKAEV